MSTTQAIIVYRNPAEAAFWESGLAWPLFSALLTFLISAVVLVQLFERIVRRYGPRNRKFWTIRQYASYAALAVSAIAAVAVFNYLAI